MMMPLVFAYHMTLLRNESKIMLYDKKMLDRYPAKDEENLRGVPMIAKMAEYNLFNRLYWKQIFEYYIFSEEMRNKNIHCDS